MWWWFTRDRRIENLKEWSWDLYTSFIGLLHRDAKEPWTVLFVLNAALVLYSIRIRKHLFLKRPLQAVSHILIPFSSQLFSFCQMRPVMAVYDKWNHFLRATFDKSLSLKRMGKALLLSHVSEQTMTEILLPYIVKALYDEFSYVVFMRCISRDIDRSTPIPDASLDLWARTPTQNKNTVIYHTSYANLPTRSDSCPKELGNGDVCWGKRHHLSENHYAIRLSYMLNTSSQYYSLCFTPWNRRHSSTLVAIPGLSSSAELIVLHWEELCTLPRISSFQWVRLSTRLC